MTWMHYPLMNSRVAFLCMNKELVDKLLMNKPPKSPQEVSKEEEVAVVAPIEEEGEEEVDLGSTNLSSNATIVMA
ncbi:hypothetical protein ACFX13_004200 [Malus domestica]